MLSHLNYFKFNVISENLVKTDFLHSHSQLGKEKINWSMTPPTIPKCLREITLIYLFVVSEFKAVVFSLLVLVNLLISPMASFQGDVLGNTSVKPRVKRALSTQQSSRLSVKHLLLELAEKNVSFAKESWDPNFCFFP